MAKLGSRIDDGRSKIEDGAPRGSPCDPLSSILHPRPSLSNQFNANPTTFAGFFVQTV